MIEKDDTIHQAPGEPVDPGTRFHGGDEDEGESVGYTRMEIKTQEATILLDSQTDQIPDLLRLALDAVEKIHTIAQSSGRHEDA